MTQASNQGTFEMPQDTSSYRTETIILSTAEADLDFQETRPERVVDTLVLRNPIRSIETKLVLFAEHFVAYRAKRRNGWRHFALINLRYLDPNPIVSSSSDMKPLRVACGAGGTAIMFAVLALASIAPAWCISFFVASTTFAAWSLYLYARRRTETVAFLTKEGRIPVLILRANFGCIQESRRLVPRLARAISAARRATTVDRNVYLRREMREHYRLQEAGAISADACSTGTRRVLGKFE